MYLPDYILAPLEPAAVRGRVRGRVRVRVRVRVG